MLTVGDHRAVVESALVEGVLACPGCDGVLAGWGHARRRVIRTLRSGVRLVLRPRRARCRGCGVTHVLLPARLLVRRADDGETIGAALELAGLGHGVRRIARVLGRSAWTVRGWVRRARCRAGVLRAGLAGWVVALDPDPPPIAMAGSAWADALSMLAAVHRAAVVRWPELADRLSLWRLAAVLTDGSLLAVVPAVRAINTSRPLVTFGD
ncbi:transposase [Nonomuraea sp. 10N515B]|uniref:transposase n=1 Tax=Nonomuraea sp. 10N515B TaxID=3457422 RepID=UPI003FCE24CA